jgi:ABC-type polysaccharide/polyol phosphate export permease
MATAQLLDSAKTQRRIVGALLMREILTRYGRHNIGFMWLFVEPMLFTSGVLILWSFIGAHRTTLPIVAFTLSGYMSVLMWRNTIARCGNALEPNRALMHHRNVRVIDLFAARILLEVAGVTMAFLLMLIGLALAGLMAPPDDILRMILAWFLLAWFSMDMALLVGSLVVLSETVERIWHVLSYLFLPLSGAFFMVDWLPKFAQPLIIWMPTVNCTELLREGLFGPVVPTHYSIAYLLVLNLALMLPGLLLIRHIAAIAEGG